MPYDEPAVLPTLPMWPLRSSWSCGDAATRCRAADQPTIDAIPTWKYWKFAVDDATGQNGGLDQLNGIAAETRVGKTTMITQEIKVNCGYGPEIWEETPGAGPSPSP